MFETGNYIEAGLWIVIGSVFAATGMRRGSDRRVCVVAACTFFLFGISDIVEVQTGAWWRPWWLLMWKAGCVLSMLFLLVQWRRRRKR